MCFDSGVEEDAAVRAREHGRAVCVWCLVECVFEEVGVEAEAAVGGDGACGGGGVRGV